MTALVLLPLTIVSVAAAQQHVGGLAGTVVDSAGRGIRLVEVIVTGTAARLLTDSTGRFRFTRSPVGNQRILLRAIGYEPRSLLAVMHRDSVTDLGRLVLTPRVQELPTLEVTGALPKPAFNQGTFLSLGSLGSATVYGWFGASMTEEGVYLIPASWRRRSPNESIRYAIVFDPPGDVVGAGIACETDGVYQVVATRSRGDEVSLLTELGIVWKAAVLADRLGGCERFARFPFQAPITAAAAVDSGWVIVLDGPGGMMLTEIDEVGRPRWLKPLAEVLQLAVPAATAVTVTATKSGAIVAQLSAPFEWVELSHAGAVLLRGSPHRGSAVADSLRARAGPGWQAFGVFPIANGYLQSIETNRRSTGWHLVYDLLGRPTRLVPRGYIAVVVASHPERRRVFGFGYPRGRLIVQRY